MRYFKLSSILCSPEKCICGLHGLYFEDQIVILYTRKNPFKNKFTSLLAQVTASNILSTLSRGRIYQFIQKKKTERDIQASVETVSQLILFFRVTRCRDKQYLNLYTKDSRFIPDTWKHEDDLKHCCDLSNKCDKMCDFCLFYEVYFFRRRYELQA